MGRACERERLRQLNTFSSRHTKPSLGTKAANRRCHRAPAAAQGVPLTNVYGTDRFVCLETPIVQDTLYRQHRVRNPNTRMHICVAQRLSAVFGPYVSAKTKCSLAASRASGSRRCPRDARRGDGPQPSGLLVLLDRASRRETSKVFGRVQEVGSVRGTCAAVVDF